MYDAYRRRLERLMTLGSPASSAPSSASFNFDKSNRMTASAIQPDPTATSAQGKSLRGVKLSEHIRYVHCDGGDDGGHGVLIFENPNGSMTITDVETKDEFRSELSSFMALENIFYNR
jgi:hypothetical protein